MRSNVISIRTAMIQDVSLILHFIRSLADYEKLLHEAVVTEEKLIESLFCERPVAHVIIGELNGVASGFALYYYNYSTFLGQSGLYLEDLFVTPESRGCGLGKALILHLAKQAYQENCGRMDWAVLNWNQPSIEFYHSLGAIPQNEWTGYRLDRPALKKLLVC